MTLKKDKSTPESREFWRAVEAASRAVAKWPAWKRGGEVDAPTEPHTLATLPTGAIETWLDANAWELVHREARVATYRHPSDEGDDFVIDLPLDPGFRDYGRRMAEVLDTLAIATGRPRAVLLSEVGEMPTKAQPDFVLEGTVVVLESADPAGGGQATIVGSVDGRRVRVHLDGDDYKLAIRAHDKRVLLRCEGELAKRGARFELDRARHVQLVVGEE